MRSFAIHISSQQHFQPTRLDQKPIRIYFRGGRGFTLIELLLVLVVLGVLAGGVVVSLAGRRQGYELETAAKDVATVLRYAQANARLNSKPYRVVFREQGRVVRVEAQRPNDASGWQAAVGVPGRAYRLPGDVRLAVLGRDETAQVEGLHVVEFSSMGAASVDRLVLANNQLETVTLRVMLATGQVEVSEVTSSRQDGGVY